MCAPLAVRTCEGSSSVVAAHSPLYLQNVPSQSDKRQRGQKEEARFFVSPSLLFDFA